MHMILRRTKFWSRVNIFRWLNFFSSKIWRWLKIGIIHASNLISLRILSYLRIFELKKLRHRKILTRDQRFEQKLMVRIFSYLEITCICNNVTWLPLMSFWAISIYPRTSLTFIEIPVFTNIHKIVNEQVFSRQDSISPTPPLSRSWMLLNFFTNIRTASIVFSPNEADWERCNNWKF